jgi:single-stranded DNA-binding protein
MNMVTLIGTVATDMDLRELGGGRQLARFLVAVPRPGTRDRSDVVPVTVRNRQAGACGRVLARGSRVAIDGKLRSRLHREPGGRRRRVDGGRVDVDVVAASVQFLSSRSDGGGRMARATSEGEAAMPS